MKQGGLSHAANATATEKSLIIIGAGIAGLATGCYARMNGYRTTIFESHTLPGGLCTTWKRKGYAFDGCIHNLAGTGAGSMMHPVWAELGAARDWQVIDCPEFTRVEGPDGKALTFYTDLDRLERHLKELAPADAKVIDEYIRAARRFARHDMMGMLSAGPGEMLTMLPLMPSMIKWFRTTLEQFGQRFTDPFLRRAFPCVLYDVPDVPAAVSLFFLSGMHNKDLGWPAGGSLAFARSIEGRYLELGGEIRYGARAAKILTENGRAVGVRLADGTEHRADYVVSAADGHATIFEMLEGRYTNEKIRRYYAKPPRIFPMTLQVSLGVARNLSAEPHSIVLLLDRPVSDRRRGPGQARRGDLQLGPVHGAGRQDRAQGDAGDGLRLLEGSQGQGRI